MEMKTLKQALGMATNFLKPMANKTNHQQMLTS